MVSSAARPPSIQAVLRACTKTRTSTAFICFLHYGDVSDSTNLIKLLYRIQPDEVYHLAAQSHVRVSFDIPEYTGDTTAMGTIRILEAIRESRIEHEVLPGRQLGDVRACAGNAPGAKRRRSTRAARMPPPCSTRIG